MNSHTILKLSFFYSKSTNTPFAVFVLAEVEPGLYAATTRAADRGELGRIGLPGGKVDPGESPEDAAIRESAEEGFKVQGPLTLIHEDFVDGKLIWWYRALSAKKLKSFKEQGRIKPILVPLKDIAESGYGNEFLK